MLEMTIEIDVDEIKERLGVLSDQSGKVIARAVNRAYPTGRTAIARETKKRYRITQKDVNGTKVLKVTKATAANPTAILSYTGEHENLSRWNGNRAVSPNRIIKWAHGKPNVRQYKAAVKRGSMKKLGGDNKPFIQKVRSGEKAEFTGLFRRENKRRDAPLVSVFAPAVPQIIKNEETMEQFRRAAGPMLQKRLEHEIDVVLKGTVK